MNTIIASKAAQTLPQLIQDTIKNCEETIIVSEEGSVVLIDQNEWESIQETLKLLQDPIAFKALLDGHRAREQGENPKSFTVDEVFNDLQS